MHYFVRTVTIVSSTTLIIFLFVKAFHKGLILKEDTKKDRIIVISIILCMLLLVPIVTDYLFNLALPDNTKMWDVIWGKDTVWCVEKNSGSADPDIMSEVPSDAYFIYIVDTVSGKKIKQINSGYRFHFFYWQKQTGWYMGEKGIFGIDLEGAVFREITLNKLNESTQVTKGQT